MTREQAKIRIEKLKELINHHRYMYHVLDKQEISDSAFDSLKHELYKLEQEYPEFITPDSPTQRVGGKPLKEFRKVEHETLMLSIEDIFSEKELYDWENYLKRLEPFSELEYFSELKIDGFAITLIYENGVFVTGATRGNGKIGEDVTQNLKTIESIPLKLRKIPANKLEIRGEVYMEKKEFEKFNKEREKKGEETYSNPRNLAAGSIRQLDPKLAASRPLKFLAYDIVTDIGLKKHSEEHKLLPDLGFKTDPGKICKNLDEVTVYWREVTKKRESLPYQIDGVVISVNDNNTFQKLGVAGKSPRGIRAFKFSPKQATTKIIKVDFQVGRTGVVTPVARLEPVEVSGVTISRATLHNEDEIKRLGVKIGDTVIIERAGDVIPAVARVIKELRTRREKDIHFPKNCPSCKTKLIRVEDEVAWRCPNLNCSAIRRENLYHFVSKKSFDIKGLGPMIINQLVDEHLISGPSDIFELKEGDLLPLERFGEKKTSNLIEAVEKSKNITLNRFIYSLGIRHVGEETAFDLANYFGNIKKISEAKQEELEKIPDVGEKVSESIYQWFKNKTNKDLIEKLLRAGIKIISPGTGIKSQKLKGKTFVLTGTLETMTRDIARNKIRLLGAEISDSVSSNTDYLVVGKEPGPVKLNKAKELKIKTIREKELLDLIS